jgi:hypothetical protein
MHNLKRLNDISLTNYIWFIEFHEEGFPHWSLIVEIKEAITRKAMCTLIKKYWAYGLADSKPVKSDDHLENLSKYFDKKKPESIHQSTLPDWAMRYKKTIRRYGCKNRTCYGFIMPKNLSDRFPTESLLKRLFKRLKNEEKASMFSSTQGKSDRHRRSRYPYFLILGNCGQKISVKAYQLSNSPVYRTFDYPYKSFLEQFPDGEYESGEGYLPFLSPDSKKMIMESNIPLDMKKFFLLYT